MLFLLGSAGCSRPPASPSFTRLAVLPANVLIESPSSEWLRVAAPLVLEQDLSPVSSLLVSVAPSESAVYRLGSAEALRVTITDSRGQLDISGDLFQTSTQSARAHFSARAQPSRIIAGLNALAKQVNPGAASFATANDHALELFSAGLTATDPSSKVAKLRQAIAADPSFGLAYLALVETLAANRSPDLAAALHSAASHQNAFTALDRARFDLLAAQFARAPIRQQIAAAGAVTKVNPNNADALSALGSGLFLTGDASGGEQALSHALAVNPANFELKRQLAVGFVESRQYGQAEKLLANGGPNPYAGADLASCILLAGDKPRAIQVFQGFLKTITNPDARTLFAATWRAWTGDLSGAIGQLQSARFTDRRATELAAGQILIWQLLNSSPGANLPAQIAALPGANGEANTLVNAYGLYLYGRYAEATEAWTAILQQSGGADLRARAMLAASAKRAGRPVKVTVLPFLPEVGDLYSAVSFGALKAAL